MGGQTEIQRMTERYAALSSQLSANSRPYIWTNMDRKHTIPAHTREWMGVPRFGGCEQTRLGAQRLPTKKACLVGLLSPLRRRIIRSLRRAADFDLNQKEATVCLKTPPLIH
jgi:hypothetical protein